MQKKYRQEKRLQRKALSTLQKQQYSEQITAKFLESEAYKKSNNIGVYLALNEEVNVQGIIRQAWIDGKSVYLPVVAAKHKIMRFAPYKIDSILTKDCMNIDIPEAPLDTHITAEALEVVIMPLVAFDINCNRIGMGGGYYDCTFAFTSEKINAVTQLIGVAFEIQRVDGDIAVQDWDIAPDSIITEVKTYNPGV